MPAEHNIHNIITCTCSQIFHLNHAYYTCIIILMFYRTFSSVFFSTVVLATEVAAEVVCVVVVVSMATSVTLVSTGTQSGSWKKRN